MVDASLAKKLQLKPGQRASVVHAPPGYLAALDPPAGVQLVDDLEGLHDFIHVFVTTVAELEELAPATIGALKPDGILWISYPKRSSKVATDITRDTGWDSLHRLGFRSVSQVSIDDVWSALRFRPGQLPGR